MPREECRCRRPTHNDVGTAEALAVVLGHLEWLRLAESRLRALRRAQPALGQDERRAEVRNARSDSVTEAWAEWRTVGGRKSRLNREGDVSDFATLR